MAPKAVINAQLKLNAAGKKKLVVKMVQEASTLAHNASVATDKDKMRAKSLSAANKLCNVVRLLDSPNPTAEPAAVNHEHEAGSYAYDWEYVD